MPGARLLRVRTAMTGAGEYDVSVGDLLERMLVTVIGTAGFWGRRLYLVGGLVPRYLYGPSGSGMRARDGARDLDLAVRLLIDDPTLEAYETLSRNLVEAGFRRAPFADDPGYRWRKGSGISSLVMEFICDTGEVPPGGIFAPGSGSKPGVQALNVRGARLVGLDAKLVLISADTLDGRGTVNVGLQIAGLMPFMVLKILALVDGRRGRDAYDIVWSLANHRDGPRGAGRQMAESPIAADPLAVEALAILRKRFAEERSEGPMAYAAFLGVAGSLHSAAGLRLEAVDTVRAALKAFDEARAKVRSR